MHQHVLFVATILVVYTCVVSGCSYGRLPCASGCTPALGLCVADQCYDRKGKLVECEPDYEDCNGMVCSLEEFCAGSVCLPSTCKNRRLYSCASDTSPLRSVSCANASYTDCYASEHFNCSLGENRLVEVSCSKPATSAASTAGLGGLLVYLSVATVAALAAAAVS